jgi:hypothetical protein
MPSSLMLPRPDGTCAPYVPGRRAPLTAPAGPFHSRVAYAAAHVVCNPLADVDPTSEARLDWDATLAYRRHLWSLGLGVAEAMDTAQRGMGLGWDVARDLIRRAASEAHATPGARLACGAGTDHLQPGPGVTLDDVEAAYAEQCGFVEGQGARIILMASRALAACARGPDDYLRVYDRILSQVTQPVIIHWLGAMFDPALAGYWGSHDLEEAMEVCLALIARHAARIDGIKISLLDARREIALRRRLPPGAIAPAASVALHALDGGDVGRYEAILEPTVPLSRHIFAPPTRFYKTGIVFMAYLNGHQSHFRMVGGLESARSVVHLAELFVLADRAGLLRDPELAAKRMRRVLAVAGIA